MSDADERALDPSKAAKAGMSDDGAEVEGHRALRNEDEPVEGEGKKGLTEDDGAEVEGHVFRAEPNKALKKG
jgi:hypothetical protein